MPQVSSQEFEDSYVITISLYYKVVLLLLLFVFCDSATRYSDNKYYDNLYYTEYYIKFMIYAQCFVTS